MQINPIPLLFPLLLACGCTGMDREQPGTDADAADVEISIEVDNTVGTTELVVSASRAFASLIFLPEASQLGSDSLERISVDLELGSLSNDGAGGSFLQLMELDAERMSLRFQRANTVYATECIGLPGSSLGTCWFYEESDAFKISVGEIEGGINVESMSDEGMSLYVWAYITFTDDGFADAGEQHTVRIGYLDVAFDAE